MMEVDIRRHEVLSGERFSHVTEPTLSFSHKAIRVNMECLKRVPDTIYVHLLLFRPEKNMIIKPCDAEERDAVRWRTISGKPRNILFDEAFWINITTLMGWDDNNRYRLLGRVAHGSGWSGLTFDMTRAVVLPVLEAENATQAQLGKATVSHQTWEEHNRNPLVSRFTEDTQIMIDEE